MNALYACIFVSQVYKKHRLLQKPENIFVVTELKVAACPHVSAYIACSANGTSLAPFVVFHSDPVDRARFTAYSLPEFKDALFFNAKYTHEGDALFVWFRDHFVRWKAKCLGHLSVNLFVGCPVSEISLRLVQLAEEERVALVSVPSTIAHLVQPLNAGILSSLNAAISAGIEQLVTEGRLSAGSTISHSLMAMLLAQIWTDKWLCDDVSKAFASCGIFPLNVSAITMERIASASVMSDNASDSYAANESDEDADEDVTHGLNLLSELSTVKQQQEQRNVTCTKQQLVAADAEQHERQYVQLNTGETCDHLQVEETEISREVLQCLIDEDRISSSVVCQPCVFTEVSYQKQCDQSDHIVPTIHETRHMASPCNTLQSSNYTSRPSYRSALHKNSPEKGKKGRLTFDETCNYSSNSLALKKNVAPCEKVLCASFTEVTQKPATSPSRLIELDYCVHDCDSQINAHNSNIDAPMQVIYVPSTGNIMSVNVDNGDSTQDSQIELDVAAECTAVEDSCQQVCCEVIIC